MRILTIALAAMLLMAPCADDDGSGDRPTTAARQQAPPLAPGGADPGTQAAAPSGVSVVGEGRVSGTPDTLRVTVGVEVVRPTVDEALSVANERAAAGGDAARMRGVSFALEDNQPMLEAAREAAFEDARTKAQHYAALADRELGALVAVSEHTTTPPPVERFAEGGAAAERPVPQPPLQPGEQEVVVRVQTRWSLD